MKNRNIFTLRSNFTRRSPYLFAELSVVYKITVRKILVKEWQMSIFLVLNSLEIYIGLCKQFQDTQTEFFLVI